MIYDRLFTSLNPDSENSFIDFINPESLEILENCQLEPDLKTLESNIPIQFERLGYFFKDLNSTNETLIFNRTVALRDTWAKK
jgi:glutaminyl-tRNA synthetase